MFLPGNSKLIERVTYQAVEEGHAMVLTIAMSRLLKYQRGKSLVVKTMR